MASDSPKVAHQETAAAPVTAVFLSGESVDVDVSGVASIPELRHVLAEYLKVSEAMLHLMQADKILGHDAASTLDPTQGPVIVVVRDVDLSKIELENKSDSEFDEGTGYSSCLSELFYDGAKIWSKYTSSTSNIGGARGSSHTAVLSEDKATLTVKEIDETRSVGQRHSGKNTTEILSVAQLIVEAEKRQA
eukprot:TRINITY_DN6366_c0_g2_i1.p1 TRINITY_DN6366_c0_g2~~TRINITY_DN6366_c0_g2_i1.p1  ORF type:complete len:215 (+),score=28.26 TRINITY_DN6366_c0_g2_i1:75-647(+)